MNENKDDARGRWILTLVVVMGFFTLGPIAGLLFGGGTPGGLVAFFIWLLVLPMLWRIWRNAD